MLELEADLDSRACRVPDAPGEFGRAVSALRLATPGAIAAGPVLFERLDWRPYGVRPMPATAAQVPPGEATRLDVFRAPLVIELQTRLADAPETTCWRRSTAGSSRSFTPGPTRADELREALEALLGLRRGPLGSGDARRRAPGRDRAGAEDLLTPLRALLDGDGPGARAEDAVRRALVETLLAGLSGGARRTLDEALLGLRPDRRSRSSSRVLAAG